MHDTSKVGRTDQLGCEAADLALVAIPKQVTVALAFLHFKTSLCK